MTVHREALPGFAAFPERLAAAVLGAEQRAVPEGEWTPEQVVRHLIAVDGIVYQRRFTDLAAGDGARWSWTEPGPWDGEPSLSLGALLDRFRAVRQATVALARSLDDEAWARMGEHETFGPLDGDGVLREAIKHDEEHLAALVG